MVLKKGLRRRRPDSAGAMIKMTIIMKIIFFHKSVFFVIHAWRTKKMSFMSFPFPGQSIVTLPAARLVLSL